MLAALRFPASIALAIGINLLLMLFVIRLVTGERERPKPSLEDITVIDFVRLVREVEAPRRTQREVLPEPPAETVKPPPPPEQPVQTKPPEQPPMRMLAPELAPPLNITGAPALPAVAPPKLDEAAPTNAPVAIQEAPAAPAPSAARADAGEPQFDADLQAIFKPDPKYPLRALRAGIEGTVTVEFIVTPEGGVRDVRVVKAEPPGVFDDAAVRGVMKWKFQPKVVEGKPIARKARQDIRFELRRG